MLFILRQVRRKLMTENKFTTYLLYAVGEIVLVVVGILIAVQIDNWNEDRKQLAEEKATIKDLQQEFEKNLAALQIDLGRINEVVTNCNLLLEHTGPGYQDGTLPNFDSLLAKTVSVPIWDPSNYTLNDIKNAGKLSKLSNEKLKVLLIDWDTFYSNLEDWGEFYENRSGKYFDHLIENSINRNMTKGYGLVAEASKFPGNNEKLMRELRFESQLIDKVTISQFVQQFYEQATGKLSSIIDECKKQTN